MRRTILLLAAIFLTMLVSSGVVLADFGAGPTAAEPGAPRPVYAVRGLGTLGGGQSIARDINDEGQVVGQVQTASGQRAFLWEAGQGMKDLGVIETKNPDGTTTTGSASFGRGINNPTSERQYAQVVGFSRTSTTANPVHGFLWERNPLTDLGTLTEVSDSGTTTTFSNSEAWHINDSGVAVGRSFNSASRGRAVLWENGQIKNLGKLLNTSYSEAWSINDLGQVVGEAGAADQQAKAFLYDNNTGKVTDIDASLDRLVFPYPFSEAAGINDHGQVIGWSYRTTTNVPPSDPLGPEGRAFLYEKAEDGTATVLPLNPLDGGPDRTPDLYSRARDIDESGRVVGWSRGARVDDAKQFSAVLWEDGKVTDLNELIPAESRWKLTDPYAINESGQIVGTGYHYNEDGTKGQLQAFLLTPDTTEPNLSVSHTVDGSNGWNKTSPVTLNVSANDTGFGLEGDPTCTDGTDTLTLTTGTVGTWTANVSGDGTHSITCTVGDKAGNTKSATDTIRIDTSAPTLSVNHTDANASGWNKTSPVTLDVSASDTGSGLAGAPACENGTTNLTLTAGSTAGTWTANVSGEGIHNISCSVNDQAGNPASASDTVKIDTLAPSVKCSVTPNKLDTFANNHKLVDIVASVDVADSGSGADGFTLVSVTSNQADSGLGPDDLPGDIQGWDNGTDDTSGQIRTERYRKDRIYTLTYHGKDLAGNTGACQATVTVPKGG
jgi:probable HAF family extracellular repeat protein